MQDQGYFTTQLKRLTGCIIQSHQMVSAIFFLDSRGQPLLSRNYRGDVPLSAVEAFPVLIADSHQPCISHQGVNYMYILHNNIYVLALSKANSDAMCTLVFLQQLIAVLEDYFKILAEESIRDNFVVVYELLDEMMDFGYPQITDAKILQEYITQETHQLDPRSSNVVTNAVSWRPSGIFYKKNELFLDVIESLEMVIDTDGTILRSQITGKVTVNAFLSGMPTLKLGLNDASRSDKKPSTAEGSASAGGEEPKKRRKRGKNVEIEDVKFHQCVELDQFDKDRTIQFVPPDGKFELMSYRIADTAAVKSLFNVDAKVDVREHSRVLVHAKISSQYRKKSVASFVEVRIPVPPDADTPRFKAANGTVVYAPEHNAILWKIKEFAGGKEYSMSAQLQLSSIDEDAEDSRIRPATSTTGALSRAIQIKFEIPYLAVSGLQVRYLKVTEPILKYQSLPWVRYLTQSGLEYTVRT